MVDRLLSNLGVQVREPTEPVVVILERVRVDGSDLDPEVSGVIPQRGVIVHRVPGDVERHRGREAGVPVNLGRVGYLLGDRPRHACGTENLEAGSRIAEGPRGNFDPKLIELGVNATGQHRNSSATRRAQATMGGRAAGAGRSSPR